jgi:endoribonuclease Dicer
MCAFSVITFLFVQGTEMSSKKMAKRAAALETCKRLHKLGELNEHLLPVEHENPIEACAELFPLYKEEIGDNVPQRGSSKRKEQYTKEVCLQFCSPPVWSLL